MPNNDSYDYSIYFSSITQSDGNILFINHSTGDEQTFGFTIDDQDLRYRSLTILPTAIADLIDLAVSIYAADRLVSQNLQKKQSKLHIVIPLRDPEIFNRQSFKTQLEELLEWSTGSRWSFCIQERTAPDRVSEHPVLPIVSKDCEIALWSGGLDALAGLYTRLKGNPTKTFILFGTGSNTIIHKRQQTVAEAIDACFPGRATLYRMPIRFNKSQAHPKNSVPRARGVVFSLLGAACAYLMGSKELCIYENGIGAINLPYRKSAIGLDHSRSVHPLTLLRVSSLVSELIGEPFRIRNPFLFSTKAEMCEAMAQDKQFDLPPITKSCDSPHRKRPSQCGYCSSCILRKQSLAASSIEDKTQYVVPHGERPVGKVDLYLRHMLAQIVTIRSIFSNSETFDSRWASLAQRFPELDDIVDRSAQQETLSPFEMKSKLIDLYQRYINEWEAVESQISRSLSNQIIEQNVAQKYLSTVQ